MQVLLVVPRVFRAPEGPAAREARRPHFVRRRASKPARALRSLRRPPHQWGRVAVRQLYASSRSPARPRHRPRAPQPGPPVPPAPSTPVGPVVLMRIHIIAEPTRNFARNSPTSLSNSEIRSLELQRFPTLLKLLLIELRATFPVTSPRHSPVPPTKPHKREKIRPARLHQCPRAKKFAQHRQNCPKSALFRLQGELFRGMAQNPLLLGEFFRADGCRSHLTPPADRLA